MISKEIIEGIAGRTVQGSLYSGGAAIITFVLGFVRAVLLARLLLPEHFGVITLAFFFIGISNFFRRFGLDSAVIHYQNDGEALRRTYFSLQIGLYGLVTGILITVSPIIQNLYPQVTYLGDVLISLSILSFIYGLSMVQMTFIRKELVFSHMALTEISSSVVTTIVAPYVAWLGWGVWALVAERATDILTRFILTWGPFRRWRPRFGWDRQAGELFWRFGKPTWVKRNVDYLLERFDDFWIGSVVGLNPLGYYAKAYDFACAPRRVFAAPLLKVFVPVFALIQMDRERLSLAFFRCAHLLVRSVFFGAGFFALIMPEFIHLVIGDKWLPMLWTFRLLLIYAAFDSFLVLINGLLIAVGKPHALRNATLIQAVFFIPAVIIGAHLAGINGVAIATNGMLLIGILYLYGPLVETIDFWVWRLFGWPVLALSIAMGSGMILESLVYASPLQSFFLKLGIFTIIFSGILVLIEGKDYARDLKEMWDILKHNRV